MNTAGNSKIGITKFGKYSTLNSYILIELRKQYMLAKINKKNLIVLREIFI